jgi:ABC-2 type transport system ATP-binding protein
LATVAARPFRTLSGGSKQKLLIALAIAARPDLLILDEPTASLDADARSRFFQLHRDRASGATLILCSHRLEEIRTRWSITSSRVEDGRRQLRRP